MKQVIFSALCGLLIGLSGCSSVVKTYDAEGRLIGSCKATRGPFSLASATCVGHANAMGVDYNHLNHASGLLPELPPSSVISFK